MAGPFCTAKAKAAEWAFLELGTRIYRQLDKKDVSPKELFLQLFDTSQGSDVGMKRAKGNVYLISCEATGTCKIGYSTDVPQRLKALQAANATPLLLRGMIPGSIQKERSLHKKFSQHRLEGEWFSQVDEITEYFATGWKKAA
jgi:hypothetical protein